MIPIHEVQRIQSLDSCLFQPQLEVDLKTQASVPSKKMEEVLFSFNGWCVRVLPVPFRPGNQVETKIEAMGKGFLASSSS